MAEQKGLAIPKRHKSGSLWADALYRLARNRAAIIGGILLVLLTLCAILARYIAPHSYEKQVRKHDSVVPRWVLTLFPATGSYAKAYLFSIEHDVGTVIDALDRGQVPDTLREQFQEWGKTLNSPAQVNVRLPGNGWVITATKAPSPYLICGEMVAPSDCSWRGEVKANPGRTSRLFGIEPTLFEVTVSQADKEALNDGQLPSPIAEQFKTYQRALTGTVRVSLEEPDKKWAVEDANNDYYIQYNTKNLRYQVYLKADLDMVDRITDQLDQGEVSALLLDEFRKRGELLTAESQLTVEKAGSKWALVQGRREYLVRLEGQQLYVYRPYLDVYAKFSDAYILGTDALGRDLLSRLIYGAQISLSVALVGPLVALLVGTVYGLVSGFFGKTVDNLMMRFVDLMYAIPSILLIILMMVYFRSSLSTVSEPGTMRFVLNSIDQRFGGMFFIFIGIGLTAWMGTARLARGQVLSLREQEFVLAARAIGSSNSRIIFRHILPNILGPLVITVTLAIPGYISTEAFLSFIGLGVNPPTPSWGSMIADGAAAIRSAPLQALLPALALSLTMFAFNFLGDGLRDALDPRLRGT